MEKQMNKFEELKIEYEKRKNFDKISDIVFNIYNYNDPIVKYITSISHEDIDDLLEYFEKYCPSYKHYHDISGDIDKQQIFDTLHELNEMIRTFENDKEFRNGVMNVDNLVNTLSNNIAKIDEIKLERERQMQRQNDLKNIQFFIEKNASRYPVLASMGAEGIHTAYDLYKKKSEGYDHNVLNYDLVHDIFSEIEDEVAKEIK